MMLPFSTDALEPTISAETISYHYGKHHQAYVNKLNAAIDGTPLADKSLEEIIRTTVGKDPRVFNNAAQIWNHDLYWRSLSPTGGGEPTGKIAESIRASFGSFASFREMFSKAAASQFGSGWAWLVAQGNRLSIETTLNAHTPIAHGRNAIMTLDVWEHAYYIDYRNARAKYIDAFWKLVDWNQVAERL